MTPIEVHEKFKKLLGELEALYFIMNTAAQMLSSAAEEIPKIVKECGIEVVEASDTPPNGIILPKTFDPPEHEKEPRILKNAIQCKKCGQVIESRHVHDFKFCKCGAVAVDGGHDYLRRVGDPENYTDLSEFEEEGDEK